MTIGLVGRKCGMTRVFTEDGRSIPVTVVQALPNRVTRVKTVSSDGYSAVQVTTGSKKSSRVSRPVAGQHAAANSESGEGLFEFRVDEALLDEERLVDVLDGFGGFRYRDCQRRQPDGSAAETFTD